MFELYFFLGILIGVAGIFAGVAIAYCVVKVYLR